jgi:membrane-bound lytic murein transglycosylase D
MKIQQIRTCSLCFLLLLVMGLSSPAFSRSRNVRVFVPPATKPLVNTFALEESVLLEHTNSRDTTHAVPEKFNQTPQDVEVDMRISRARHHLGKGAELLNQGKGDQARVEFDRCIQYLTTAPAGLSAVRLQTAYQQVVEEIHRLEVEAVDQSNTETEPVFDPSPIDDIARMTFPLEPGLKAKVKEQLHSTVSQLPLEMADPVLGFINYFSSPRGRMTFEYGLKRSGRYAAMIRRILDEEGLPQELIFMAQAESAFLPRAVSVKSATGMWQFMQWRGQEYGLRQTGHSDDRLDPEKATRAAARHLRDLYAQFGDWYLAIAAYNCGPVNVERAIQRTGYADFWELYSRNVLPRETANYLPIIVAMTIMAKNPKDYGLDKLQLDPSLEYDTIKVSAPTHMALIADLTRRPLQEVREMNPALLKLIAPAGYEVHVAKGSGRTVLAALESVPAVKRAAWRVHRVTSNETVASIARQYRIPEKSITEANGVDSLDPQAGDFVMIPVSYPGVEVQTAKMRSGSRTTMSSKRRGTTARRTASSPRKATAKSSKSGKSTRQTASKTPKRTQRASAAPASRPTYASVSMLRSPRAQ